MGIFFFFVGLGSRQRQQAQLEIDLTNIKNCGLEFLDDNRIGNPRLLYRLVQIIERLWREPHHLQLITTWSTRPRCINKSTDVSDCVLVVEARNHARTICQP